MLQNATYEHVVNCDGAACHVVETRASAGARALLLLPGTLVTANMFDVPLAASLTPPAPLLAARMGFTTFAVTYEGYGQSAKPADGRDVTAMRLLQQVGQLVAWICARQHVQTLDVVGVSLGAALACALANPKMSPWAHRVGKIVLMSMVYKHVMHDSVLSPQLEQMFLTVPHGYIQTRASMYDGLLTDACPTVRAWATEHLPGTYAVGPTLAAFHLPVFACEKGYAQGLQIWGDADPMTPRADMAALQHDYGDRLQQVILAGAGHAPMFSPQRALVWEQVLTWLR